MPEQLTRQEQLFGIRDAEFGTLEAENARLYPFLRAAKSLVNEAKVDPTDDGLHICAVDGANVCMVDADVTLDGAVPDETFGVNIKRLAGQLQNKPRDVTITIECAIPNGMLRLDEEFSNGKVWDIRERVGFLDPDSIRQRPDIPELDFDAVVTLDLAGLSKILNRLPDSKPVELQAKDGELSIGSTVKSADVEDGEYHTLATTEFDGDGEATALYPHGYLKDICAGVTATGADSVRLSWSEEFPVKIEAYGEHVTTEWYLAPRIHS